MAFRALLAGVLTLALPLAASAGDDLGDRREQLERLVEVTGASDIGLQMGGVLAHQFYEAIHTANPSLPTEALQLIEDVVMEVVAAHQGDLMERALPLYARHFTSSEVDDMIRFYETPTGRKAIREMPQVLSESIAISRAWAQGLQPELERRIRERLTVESMPRSGTPGG